MNDEDDQPSRATQRQRGCDGCAGSGEDFVITRNGRPVGELRPITTRQNLTTAELKKRLARFAGIANAADERAEIDGAFGEGRLDD